MRGVHILSYPSYIILEVAQGCNRACEFCPIVSHKRSELRLMDSQVFDNVLNRFDHRLRRVDISLHGEPFLNPNIVDYVEKIRIKLPDTQISIISNVEDLIRKDFWRLLQAFEKGLNFLHADTYTKEVKDAFISLLRANKSKLSSLRIKVFNFVSGGINIWSYHSPETKIILVNDESEGFQKKTIRNVHTCGGNLPFELWEKYGIDSLAFPLKSPCTEPMKCLPIDVEGKARLCCADNNKSLFFGNLNKSPVEEIWNGEQYQEVRYLLSKGLRNHIPACYFCNRRSFRTGLWPYKGKEYDKEKLKIGFWERSKFSNNLCDLFVRFTWK